MMDGPSDLAKFMSHIRQEQRQRNSPANPQFPMANLLVDEDQLEYLQESGDGRYFGSFLRVFTGKGHEHAVIVHNQSFMDKAYDLFMDPTPDAELKAIILELLSDVVGDTATDYDINIEPYVDEDGSIGYDT